jgi:SAM-dependent methyltransferase
VGEELHLFAHATHWKAYWTSRILRWVSGDVLEVGAGIGGNTALLHHPSVRSWLCLEPDPELAQSLRRAVAELPNCRVVAGTVATVQRGRFDSILYIDVLEHIEADEDELRKAAELLRPGGRLIVLAPAHQFLYSSFDAAIGHFRRYNRTSLQRCSPPCCRLEAMFYLDSLGMFASLANRLLLSRALPTAAQIKTWDSYIIPLSRIMDPMLGYAIGKTIVLVATRLAAF